MRITCVDRCLIAAVLLSLAFLGEPVAGQCARKCLQIHDTMYRQAGQDSYYRYEARDCTPCAAVDGGCETAGNVPPINCVIDQDYPNQRYYFATGSPLCQVGNTGYSEALLNSVAADPSPVVGNRLKCN